MADTPQNPQLGYGQKSEASIDHVNQWMRGTDWYNALLKSWGQDPANVHLADWQKEQVLRAAQANGVVVDEGHNGMEIDDAGNFNPKGHKLRNTLIVAGIAAATIATMGAAGAFSGGAAGAMGGAAGTGGTLAGVEGGAYGLGSGAVAALGTGAMGAVPVAGAIGSGAGMAALGAGGAADAGGAGAFDAAGNFIGSSTVTGASGATGAGGALSTAERLANLARTGSGLVNATDAALHGGIDPTARGSAAANAAAQEARNRLYEAEVGQSGTSADARALDNMRRAGLMSTFKGTEPSAFGSPAINLDPATQQFARDYMTGVNKNVAAGKAPTISGIAPPGPQELADEEAARQASQGKSGNGVVDAIGTGARIASLIPGYINLGRQVVSYF